MTDSDEKNGKTSQKSKDSEFEQTIELESPVSSEPDQTPNRPTNLRAERHKMRFLIRPYRDSDFERFFELHREMVHSEFDPHGLLNPGEFEERLLRTLERFGFPSDDNMIFVAETPNHEYAGHIWFAQKRQTFNGKPEARIYDVSVRPRFQSMGLGNALLQKAEEFARDLGIPQATLHLFTPNPTARRLFETRGFRIASLKFSKPL